MTTIHSPHNIEILLWCHTRTEQHERVESMGVREALMELLAMGAIERTGQEFVYTTTRLGSAWVAALCNVPPPKAVYVDEAGRILDAP